VVECNRDKQRYLLQCRRQREWPVAFLHGQRQPEAVALQVDNLVKASYLESMQAQYLLLRCKQFSFSHLRFNETASCGKKPQTGAHAKATAAS
jgi:hypothetical protein